MIRSDKGEVEVSGYGYEVMAEFQLIVMYLKETMKKTMGDEKAKVYITKEFIEALTTNIPSDGQYMISNINIKEWGKKK